MGRESLLLKLALSGRETCATMSLCQADLLAFFNRDEARLGISWLRDESLQEFNTVPRSRCYR